MGVRKWDLEAGMWDLEAGMIYHQFLRLSTHPEHCVTQRSLIESPSKEHTRWNGRGG